ncbi:Crp/Fnr family transcriptional regulator [Aeromicrobium panaciterrae]|uniref:Crp/Fnr family transcriptional regulator n=1 Tax=Aeromicrobium panaciterrae TaxID=363861 RepID=UPI0031D8015C
MAVSSVGAIPRSIDWALLASLPEVEREQLLARTRRRGYARNEVLVREGDPSDSLHLVEQGRLAIRVDTAAGDTALLNVIGPGDWFGELSLLGNGNPTRTATVVALEPATTRALTTSAFADLRQRYPASGELLLSLLSSRVEELSIRLVETMYDNLDRRVHRRLLDLVRVYGDGDPGHPVTVPLTQEQLAGLVGGTRPSVNEVLQRLARRGVVELGRGRIVVHQPSSLGQLAS